MIGRTISHYEILEKIGQGGMGEVYRARDRTLGRDVALKFLPEDFATDAERLQRFEREARALAALNHPHIATIHGFEESEGRGFLVLELVEGDDLSLRVARGRVPAHEAMRIMAQVAEAIEVAHASGIVHRDLKPANIKLNSDGKVKVLDFGLARVHEDLNPGGQSDLANSPTLPMERTGQGILLGTAPYMSPEQLKGQSGDARSDVWAFGCVFYELLCGYSPFWAETLAEVTARTLETDPDWARLPNDLPPAARRLLRRCLVKDPHARLHAAADVRIVLNEILEGREEADALRSAPPARSRQFVAFALIFLLGAAGAWLLRDRAEPPSRTTTGTTRLMIPVRSGASVVPLPEASSVAISPDGKVVVYVVAEAKRVMRSEGTGFGDTQLYRREIDSFDVQPISGTVGAVSPIFSPDGRSIAFFDFNLGAITRIAASGGSASIVCRVRDVTIRGMHWASDDRIYFSDMRAAWFVDANGGEAQLVAEPDLESKVKTYRFPQLLPGGDAVLLTVADHEILSYDEGEIAIFDLKTGQLHPILRGGTDARYLPTGHLVFGRAGALYAVPLDLQAREVRGQPIRVLEDVVTSEGYGSTQMCWSETGTLVYVDGGPRQFASEIMVLHEDGRIEGLGQPMRPYGQVRVSPAGDRLLLSVLGANASIWMHELERNISTRLVSGWDNYAPIWDPTGTRIAYAANRNQKISIWVRDADGAGAPHELATWTANFFPSSWSSNGHELLSTVFSRETGMDVAVCDLDGNLRPIVTSAAREFSGDFSPDDRYFVYSSDESGTVEVYVQTYPVTGRKWRLSESGGDLPIWSRKGDFIYFWSRKDLMRVPVTTEPHFQPGRVEHVVSTDVEVSGFDVFPAGDRFLLLGRRPTESGNRGMMMRAVGEGRIFPAESPDLHVVLNWFDELERLVPTR